MRIISGSARGTKLYTLSGDNTRPTLDRVKESIFNIIQNEIEGSVVLDLFSGSGVVSDYLIHFRDVVSVDIQNYSSILSEASIKKINVANNATDITKTIQQSDVLEKLRDAFSQLLEYERMSITLLRPESGAHEKSSFPPKNTAPTGQLLCSAARARIAAASEATERRLLPPAACSMERERSRTIKMASSLSSS